jgi:hypothetical protein
MFQIRACAYLTFALLLIGVFGGRLAEWLMTGQLLVANRIRPSHYVTFTGDPVEFLMGFALHVFMVWAGLMLVVATFKENQIRFGP